MSTILIPEHSKHRKHNCTVDPILDGTSTNPVQNKTLYAKFSTITNTIDAINRQLVNDDRAVNKLLAISGYISEIAETIRIRYPGKGLSSNAEGYLDICTDYGLSVDANGSIFVDLYKLSTDANLVNRVMLDDLSTNIQNNINREHSEICSNVSTQYINLLSIIENISNNISLDVQNFYTTTQDNIQVIEHKIDEISTNLNIARENIITTTTQIQSLSSNTTMLSTNINELEYKSDEISTNLNIARENIITTATQIQSLSSNTTMLSTNVNELSTAINWNEIHIQNLQNEIVDNTDMLSTAICNTRVIAEQNTDKLQTLSATVKNIPETIEIIIDNKKFTTRPSTNIFPVDTPHEFDICKQNIPKFCSSNFYQIFTTWNKFGFYDDQIYTEKNKDDYNKYFTDNLLRNGTDNWKLVDNNTRIKQTINSNDFTGYISNKSYHSYNMSVKLTSQQVWGDRDDDIIGIVLAAVYNQNLANDPKLSSSYYTISLVRSPKNVDTIDNTESRFAIYLNACGYQTPTSHGIYKEGTTKCLASWLHKYDDGVLIERDETDQVFQKIKNDIPLNGSSDSTWLDKEITLTVKNTGTHYTCTTTLFNNTGTASLDIDLLEIYNTCNDQSIKNILKLFIEQQRFIGFCAYSQSNTTYDILEFPESDNKIITLYDNQVYEQDNTGTWVRSFDSTGNPLLPTDECLLPKYKLAYNIFIGKVYISDETGIHIISQAEYSKLLEDVFLLYANNIISGKNTFLGDTTFKSLNVDTEDNFIIEEQSFSDIKNNILEKINNKIILNDKLNNTNNTIDTLVIDNIDYKTYMLSLMNDNQFLSNHIYVISTDFINAQNQEIKYLSTPTKTHSATTKLYVDTEISLLSANVSTICSDLSTDIDNLSGKVVYLTGNQTIDGIKQFTNDILIPDTLNSTSENAAVTKSYVDYRTNIISVDNIDTQLTANTLSTKYVYNNDTKELFVLSNLTDNNAASNKNNWLALPTTVFYSADKSSNIIVDSSRARVKLAANTGKEWFKINTGITLNAGDANVKGIKQILYASEGCYYICTSSGLYRTYNDDLSECTRVEKDNLCNDPNNIDSSSCVFCMIEIAMQEYLLAIYTINGNTVLHYYNSQTNRTIKYDDNPPSPNTSTGGWIYDYYVLTNTIETQENDKYVEIIFACGSTAIRYCKFDYNTQIVESWKSLDNIKYSYDNVETTRKVEKLQKIEKHVNTFYFSQHIPGDGKLEFSGKYVGLIKIDEQSLSNAINTTSVNYYADVITDFDDTEVFNIRNLEHSIISSINNETKIVRQSELFVACDNSQFEKEQNLSTGNNGLYILSGNNFESLSSITPFNKAQDIYIHDYIERTQDSSIKIDTNWYFIGYNDITEGTNDNIPSGNVLSSYIAYVAPINSITHPNGIWNLSDVLSTNFTIGNESDPEFVNINNYITINSHDGTNSLAYISPIPINPYLANLSDIKIRGIKLDDSVQKLDDNGFININLADQLDINNAQLNSTINSSINNLSATVDNKFGHLSTALHFSGVYNTLDELKAVSNPQNGDVAILSTGIEYIYSTNTSNVNISGWQEIGDPTRIGQIGQIIERHEQDVLSLESDINSISNVISTNLPTIYAEKSAANTFTALNTFTGGIRTTSNESGFQIITKRAENNDNALVVDTKNGDKGIIVLDTHRGVGADPGKVIIWGDLDIRGENSYVSYYNHDLPLSANDNRLATSQFVISNILSSNTLLSIKVESLSTKMDEKINNMLTSLNDLLDQI